MGLQITRDEDGTVTITNPATGKSETRTTGTTGRPARTSLAETQELPSHQWSRLA